MLAGLRQYDERNLRNLVLPKKSSENVAQVASQWQSFTEELFNTSKGRPLPHCPQYVNDQEALGICGRTSFHRYGRRGRRLALGALKNMLEAACREFPEWSGRKRKQLIIAYTQCSELRTGPQRTSPTDDGLVGTNLLQDPRSLVQTVDISELGKVR